MKTWQVLNNSKHDIVDILLQNRGLKTAKEKKLFFEPLKPEELTLKALNIDQKEVKKAISRIEKARNNKERVVVYGDYDADGISATAIMWEALYNHGLDVLPYIPDRFEEGYGIKAESLEKLQESKTPNIKLTIK